MYDPLSAERKRTAKSSRIGAETKISLFRDVGAFHLLQIIYLRQIFICGKVFYLRQSFLFAANFYLPDICSSCFMIIFLTISPPMLPACAEVKSPL